MKLFYLWLNIRHLFRALRMKMIELQQDNPDDDCEGNDS